MYIQNGPYLQDPKKDSILICWETDAVTTSEVRVYRADHPHVPAKRISASNEVGVFHGKNGKLHQVKVDGLSVGTDYYYEVCSRSETGAVSGGPFSFRTAPEETDAFSFVLTAEHGGAWDSSLPHTTPLLELIRRERPDFIQSVGDLLSDGKDASQWNFWFFRPFQNLLCNTPFYPCVGNHEVGGAIKDCDVDGCYSNYLRYFAFPRNYSFDYGCAHFCVLDCPSMFERIDRSDADAYLPILKDDFQKRESYQFLEQDLAQSNAVWKFVVFHYPPYASAHYEVPELRIFAPLFEKYGVDIVFNSHAILYERSHPIREDRLNPSGVRYILVGGFAERDQWFWDKSNKLSAKRAARPNYVYAAVTPWSFELQAIDYEGKLFDTLKLEK